MMNKTKVAFPTIEEFIEHIKNDVVRKVDLKFFDIKYKAALIDLMIEGKAEISGDYVWYIKENIEPAPISYDDVPF